MTQNRQCFRLLQVSHFYLALFLPFQSFAIGSTEIETDAPLLAQVVGQQTDTAKQETDAASSQRSVAIEKDKFGPVEEGDNLFQIARAAIPRNTKLSLQDAMQAIFEANPHAFLGTMEQIKLGAYLTIPSFSEEALDTETPDNQPASPVQDSIALPADNADSAIEEGIKPFLDEPAKQQDASPEISSPEETPLEQEPATKLTEEQAETPQENSDASTEPAASPETIETTTPSEDNPASDVQPSSEIPDSTIKELSKDTQTFDDFPTNIEAPLAAPPQKNQPVQEGLNNELIDVRSQLTQAREELGRLISERESKGGEQTSINRMRASLAQKPILQWVPWILVGLMLPALLFLLLRRRKLVDTPLNPEYTDIDASETDISNTINEFESPTLTGQSTTEKPGDTVEIMTSPVFGLHDDRSKSDDTNDLEPSGPDTRQSLHPRLLGKNPSQTLEGEEKRIKEADASLDTSQEAEIYLAYEQYSLAERTIHNLLESEPDNDRNLLLQLKLYAETGRMSELNSLSAELLEKHPDSDSETHQQIQNICEVALKNQHATKTITQLPTSEIASDTATQNLDDTAEDEIIEEKEEEIEEIETVAENPDSDGTYSDDIADYLSDNSLSEMDGLSADTMSIEYEDFAHALLDDNAPLEDLTEQEMDAISAEMELMDDPDQVIMEPTSSLTDYPETQGLSDADPHYSTVEDATVELKSQDRDADTNATDLDIPFDQDPKLAPPSEDKTGEKNLSEGKPL
ncbi:MAG: hypothetical protein DSZ28_07485 [Thiothrix sp.]|nr:MAG: hypothetical protein DSZ28_07485 [Thiothrix sp.]